MQSRAYLAVFSLFVLLAVGCASQDGGTARPATVDEVISKEAPKPAIRPDRRPLIEGPVSADGLKAILGTADLGVGPNRVGFVLTSPNGFVTEPEATVAFSYLAVAGVEGELRQTTRAKLRRWPYGNRGLYVTETTFDSPGAWRLDVSVNGPDGSQRKAQLDFEVLQSPSAPAVGSQAVRSKTRTVADVDSLAKLTTGSLQDPDLYRTTIKGAVESGLPTVLVFASPAFCTNAVCGPQVDVLQQIKDQYEGRGHFVHTDFYDNPEEIQGDLDKARLSPAVLEWRLPSIEWTFVIDKEGKVAARFEGFATFDEVEEAFQREL